MGIEFMAQKSEALRGMHRANRKITQCQCDMNKASIKKTYMQQALQAEYLSNCGQIERYFLARISQSEAELAEAKPEDKESIENKIKTLKMEQAKALADIKSIKEDETKNVAVRLTEMETYITKMMEDAKTEKDMKKNEYDYYSKLLKEWITRMWPSPSSNGSTTA